MAARITIMAGGTGGHVFPALAVADELAGRGWQISWLGTPDSFESRVVPAHGIELDTVPATRLRGQRFVARLLVPFQLAKAMLMARRVLKHRRPQVVLGMGGFVTAPGGVMARLLRIPLVIHEQNAIPGMANRWLARIATRVLEAFPGSFGTAGVETCGNPVRAEITALPAPQPIGERRLRLLVVGGSLGAQALNTIVPDALGRIDVRELPSIRHQAGRGKVEAARSAYADAGVEAEVMEFIDDMASAYAWADLVICRSGALTVSELMAAGLPAVLVPFPHAVDDHQTANGRVLVKAGAARMIQQRDMTPDALAGLLAGLLGDRTILHAMANRAHAIAQRDAARRVADVCTEVIA
jgi:UDP-N-acetylglucosamine--N-acetylmuramyl-(pentapeptide) pyrophosphoryl-undecaprenol N-acetylglucosamine transferase